jgi:SAM-dependent methyltransferase
MSSDMDVPPAAKLDATYDDEFFDDLENLVESSATTIVPLVGDLLHLASVLDVGCGRGTWLRVFNEHGVDDFVGVDGSHVEHALEIPKEAFRARDLQLPFDLGRRFDLVVSLEVGEHLRPSCADEYVATLVAHGPAVLFSAAVPFQDGPGHVNESWQSTWAARFATHGYQPFDVIRPEVWSDDHVAFWYAQNTLLYVDDEAADDLRRRSIRGNRGPLDVVHPRLHEREHATPARAAPPPSLRSLLRAFPGALRRSVSHRKGEI